MSSPLVDSVELNNNTRIPIFGLGLYLTKSGRQAEEAVRCALDAGYRHFDTAAAYGNEEDLARALSSSNVPREQVFITTKLWNQDHGYRAAQRAFDASRKKLNTDYVDLYLIHWPVENLRDDSWKALIKLYQDGLCRSIGVSNYTVRHLRELLSWSDVVPQVNQVEFSPFLYQKELHQYCVENRIALEAYTPLAKGKRLNDPLLTSLALKYGKTPAQIMIRWCIDHEIIVIPKSSKCPRIKENADVFNFRFGPEDLASLDALDEGLRLCWDPTDVD